MCADRIDIAAALSKLPPQERRDVEDLVLELVVRQADAEEQAADPTGFRLRREHAEEIARAILGDRLPPGAASAIREAWAVAARSLLEGEEGDA